MNKTVAANISGIIFNIEDSAYEKLGQYLDTIRSYFNQAEGDTEIMEDIEARIAELFQERISDAKQVISMKDVDEVIAIMGQPEDYFDSEEASEEPKTTKRSSRPRGPKRIFRDPDDQWVGGVIAGMGKYFGFDPLIMRIIWIICLFAGFGFLLYIILWILIPEAKTTAEKLQMEGEPVTVDNIKKRVELEKENLERGYKNFSKDLKDPNNKLTNTVGDVFGFIGQTILLIFKALGKIFGFIFIMAGVFLLFALGMALFGSFPFWNLNGNGNFDAINWETLSQGFFSSTDQATLSMAAILLFIGIPIIALVYSGIAVLFNVRTGIKGLGIALSTLWFLGIAMCVVIGIQLGTQFTNDTRLIETYPIEQPTGDILYIDILPDIHFSDHFEDHEDRMHELFKLDDDNLILGWPFLDVVESKTDSFEVEIRRYAHGRTQKTAIRNAQDIQFEIDQNDSLLEFSPYYWFPKDNKFRGQHIIYRIKVPVGKAIHLNKLSDRIINDIKNVQDELDEDMVGQIWTMTPYGLSSTARPGDVFEDKEEDGPEVEEGDNSPSAKDSEDKEDNTAVSIDDEDSNEPSVEASSKEEEEVVQYRSAFPLNIWRMLNALI